MPAVDQAQPTPCPICDPCGGGCDHEGAPGHRPRTLPVTPAERACATVLRAYLGYEPAPGDYDAERTVIRVIAGVECLLRDYGLVRLEDTDATPAGAALLARVEAAERTPDAPPGICQGQMHAYRCALPVGHTGLHADEGRFTLWPDAADTRPVVDAADAKGLT